MNATHKCLRLRPAAMARRVLVAAAAPGRALQQLLCRIPRNRAVVENQPHRTPKDCSSATTLELRQHPARLHGGLGSREQLFSALEQAYWDTTAERRYSSFSHTCAHTRSIYHLLSLQLFRAAPPIMIFCHVVHIPDPGLMPLPLCKSVRHER